MGTAGQNINDVYRVSSQEDRMEIMENTLLWSHLAPTAPDTLGNYHDYKTGVSTMRKTSQGSL